jgi:streptogramin lyase
VPVLHGLEDRCLLSLNQFALPTPTTALGIVADPDGNLWFTEPNVNQVGRITPAGTVTEFQVRAAVDITAGPDGNLWFTENFYQVSLGTSTRLAGARVGRITPDGRVTEFALPVPESLPSGITVGPDGNLWFTETAPGAGIGRITPDGQITEFPVPAGGGVVSDFPTRVAGGITTGPDGNLWLIGAGKIGQFILNGAGASGAAHSAPPAPRPPSTAGAAVVDALFIGAHAESLQPAVAGRQPTEAAVTAVAGSRAEVVLSPPAQQALVDVATLPHLRKQDRAVAADTAGLAEHPRHQEDRAEAADASGLTDPLAGDLAVVV